MKYLCVYCGSQKGTNPRYVELTRNLGESLARRGISLVYGGGAIGLMGTLAESVLSAGGQVIGVIPRFLDEKEIAKADCTELIVVETMAQRKGVMSERADGFLALPGGYGTLDELFESLTEAQLNIHAKPIGLWNAFGFFDPLLSWIDKAESEGFLKTKYGLRPLNKRPLLQVDSDLERLLDALTRNR
jgi:uncharacterized protein (TIGR00730 family)